MERLLYFSSSSFSSTHFKICREPTPLLPPLGLIDSSRLTFSSLPCPHCKRFKKSTSSKHDSPSTNCSRFSSQSTHRVDSETGSSQTGSSLIAHNVGDSIRRKAVTAGIFLLLNALVVLIVHPVSALPAFAAFQTAAKSRGAKLIHTELLSSAWAGFFAGCLHTLSGPDHLAALAPLSIGRSQMESAAVGALWGCGHDAGQVIFGLVFLLLKDKLHIEVIRTWGTRVVGLTLLAIGAMGIREASEIKTPCVALESGECDVSIYSTLDTPTTEKKKIGFATFATGIVHGLQPDALMMVLPALALPSRLAGAAYLITFLLGTVVAMGSYTVFIGSCSQALKDRVPRITEKLTLVSSLVAVALGLTIIVSQFFGFSLY